MGAARKLQSEIDRCLKKVQEGIDEFDQIWQKVHDTDNANQKEKYEADLKKEIKKLQRLRDQIKSWISGADIKDKSALMEARKSIEREMERFKTCEKEAKMKQFSKAALGQADKLDPREQAKAETREWINDLVDRLTVKTEQYECDVEEMTAGLKKKAKPPPKLVQLEEVVTVHKKHVTALERALRCLDNDALCSEDLDPLKDDLEYYLGMELDEHYDNTDDLYCDIADRLEAVEAAAPVASLAGHLGNLAGLGGKGPSKDGGKLRSGGGSKDDEEREKERERAAAAAAKAQLIAQGNSNVKPLEEPEERSKAAAAGPGRPAALHTAGSGSLPPPPASPLGAPGGSGGVPPSPRVPSAATGTPTPTPRGGQQQKQGDEGPLSPSAAARAGPSTAASPAEQQAAAGSQAANGPPPAGPQPAAASPAAAARPGVTLAALVGGAAACEAQAQQQAQQQQAAQAQQQQQQQAATGSQAAAGGPPAPAGGRLGAWMAGGPEAAKSPPPPAAAAAGQQQQAPAPAAAAAAAAVQPPQQTASAVLSKGLAAAKAAAGQQQAAAAAAAAAAANGPVAAAAAAAADAAAAAAAAAGGVPLLPEGASSGDLLESWAKMAASELGLGGGMFGQVPRGIASLPVLEAVMRSALPQPSDSDWNKPKPRHPIVGPASYPKSQPDVISAPGLFRKMDPEALFFAFYYQPDTYQQYLAAQELKRQSWRYHKQHNAWFQRYAEPSVTNEEYEQGTYVYFDYHVMHDDLQTGWCYRRKESFVFRYDALEDELPVSQL